MYLTKTKYSSVVRVYTPTSSLFSSKCSNNPSRQSCLLKTVLEKIGPLLTSFFQLFCSNFIKSRYVSKTAVFIDKKNVNVLNLIVT